MAQSTALMAYTVRWRHRLLSYCSATVAGSPTRTTPRPGESAAGPTARTHTVFTPACRPDAGSSHQRGTFQLRDSGSTSEASRHSRSPLLNTSPATLMRSMPSATGVPSAQLRSQSMRYHADPPCPGQRHVHTSGSFTGSQPCTGRAPSSERAACTASTRGTQVSAVSAAQVGIHAASAHHSAHHRQRKLTRSPPVHVPRSPH